MMKKGISKKKQLLNNLEEMQHELSKTQVSLKECEDKFRVAFQEAPDVIIMIDSKNGHILNANQIVRRNLGYEREALIGKHFSVLFPPSAEVSKSEMLEQLRIHGVAFEAQEFLRADGSICPMDLTVNMIPWNRDKAILVTLRDVTDRRHAEMAQEKLIQELDAFAHTVAHDLKGPLAIITGAAETLHELTMLGQEHREFTKLIMRNANKMGNIIEELLLLAETRDKEVEVCPLEMSSSVNEALQRLSYMIEEYQASIILPSTWPIALGHDSWVEEIWVNYISNAVKYGGRPPQIELGGTAQEDDMVRFWVRDNGNGLTPKEQALLFTPFTQLAQIRIEGQGLGLSIVQRIVEKLGGQVGLESEIGHGSIFSFTLPATTGYVDNPRRSSRSLK